MPTVVAFHPRVGVRSKDGRLFVIEADLPDFADENEVLAVLAKELRVRTAGELVGAIASGARGLNCSVADAPPSEGDFSVFGWDSVIA